MKRIMLLGLFLRGLQAVAMDSSFISEEVLAEGTAPMLFEQVSQEGSTEPSITGQTSQETSRVPQAIEESPISVTPEIQSRLTPVQYLRELQGFKIEDALCICSYCDFHYKKSEKGMARHISKTHKQHSALITLMNMDGLTCRLCSRSLTTVTNMIQHVKDQHLKLRPFICTICGQTFIRRYSLRSHRSKHTHVGPVIAPQIDSKVPFNKKVLF